MPSQPDLSRAKVEGRRASAALLCLVAVALGLPAPATGLGQSPPGQPSSGPGGSDYPHAGAPFKSGVAGVGGYVIYEPNPRPSGPAPVVVALHGTCIELNPCDVADPLWVKNSGALMTHLAKKGNVVVFPRYHRTADDPAPAVQVGHAVTGIDAALRRLETTPGLTAPDRDRVGLTGNSLGGWMSVHVAAALVEGGVVAHPDWAVAFVPGQDDWADGEAVPDEDLSLLPSDMRLLVAVGEDDTLAGEGTRRYGGDRVFYDTTTIPMSRKDYVRVRSDHYPIVPWLAANHGFATDKTKVDAMDYFAAWKFLDAMGTCTASGVDCAHVHGDTAAQRHMGRWSDGRPVAELCVTDTPLLQREPQVFEDWEVSCEVAPT